MANLTTKIKLYVNREVDFLKDVILQDDGNGLGAYIKGEDTIPQWAKALVANREIVPGSVAEVISNWEDGNDLIFKSGPTSEDAQQFKRSKIGQWASKIPRFKDISLSDQDENLSKTILKYSPLGLVLGILSDMFYSDLSSSLTD